MITDLIFASEVSKVCDYLLNPPTCGTCEHLFSKFCDDLENKGYHEGAHYRSGTCTYYIKEKHGYQDY